MLSGQKAEFSILLHSDNGNSYLNFRRLFAYDTFIYS